jgi:hypothetical protein
LLVAESVELVRSSAQMTLITILFGLVIMLVSWFFTSGLPFLIMTISGG